MRNPVLTHLVTLQAGGAPADDEGLDLWGLMLDASAEVQVLLLVLVVMALGSWFIIGAKLVRLMQATGKSNRFLDFFWSGEQGGPWGPERLEGVYQQLRSYKGSPLANVFRAGYVELARASENPHGTPTEHDAENVERALRRTSGNEITSLETLVPFLATTGSTAPFIGLLGTVLGIVRTFMDLASKEAGEGGGAQLAVVIPGIAEALVATAVGLAAAIPAVMAYNYFVRRIRVLEIELDSFSSDFVNIVRRYFVRG